MHIKVFMVRMVYNDCNHDRVVETIADNFNVLAWSVDRKEIVSKATFAVHVKNPDSVDTLQKVLGTMLIIGDLIETTCWTTVVEII
jgi:hypothetical protein